MRSPEAERTIVFMQLRNAQPRAVVRLRRIRILQIHVALEGIRPLLLLARRFCQSSSFVGQRHNPSRATSRLKKRLQPTKTSNIVTSLF